MSGQCGWRIEIGIAVDRAVAKKLCVGETRNHSENALLFRDTQPGLKADKIPHSTGAILLAKLHDGVRLSTGAGIAQSYRLQWTEAQRIASALGHHLDWHAALEVRDFVEFVPVILIRRDQRIEKRVVLLSRHRAVEIRPFVIRA